MLKKRLIYSSVWVFTLISLALAQPSGFRLEPQWPAPGAWMTVTGFNRITGVKINGEVVPASLIQSVGPGVSEFRLQTRQSSDVWEDLEPIEDVAYVEVSGDGRSVIWEVPIIGPQALPLKGNKGTANFTALAISCGSADLRELGQQLATLTNQFLNQITTKEKFKRLKIDTKLGQPKLNQFSFEKSSAPLCNCTPAEIEVQMSAANPLDLATVASDLFALLQANQKVLRLDFLEPVITRYAQVHASFHPDPDDVPLPRLGLANIELRRSFPTMAQGTLVAVLDTNGSATGLGSLISAGTNYVRGASAADDFDVNRNAGGRTGQGAMHGRTIAQLILQLSGGAATVLPVKVCSGKGECRETHIIEGICYAVSQYEQNRSRFPNGLILNLSLGSFTPSLILERAIRDATNTNPGNRVRVVAAAGNLHPNKKNAESYRAGAPSTYIAATAGDWLDFLRPRPNLMVYPAGFGQSSSTPGVASAFTFSANPSVVGVASLERTRQGRWQLADTSVRGRHVSIAAPGRQIVIARSLYSGTSFATGFVSALLATLPSSPAPSADLCASTYFMTLSLSPLEVGCGGLTTP